MRGLRLVALTVLVLAAVSACVAASPAADLLKGQPPAAGQYDAVMCVSVGSAPAQCGPVTADIGSGGLALVRVSDIAYRLQVFADQLGVTLLHGTMQIDGFFAPYQWSGSTLQFSDSEKNTRYELKLGTRRFDAQPPP
jgi:hypothetical protein